MYVQLQMQSTIHNATQNVQTTMNVVLIKLVSAINVLILVLELAVSTQFVKFLITNQFVAAIMAFMETHSFSVIFQREMKNLLLVTIFPVVLTLNVDNEAKHLNACVRQVFTEIP